MFSLARRLDRLQTVKGTVVLAALGLLSLMLAFPSSSVHAASVSVSITVTAAEGGAPSFTWTITGCTATPSSGTSGSPQIVTLDPSCTYTISSGPASGNGTLRDRLTGGYSISVSETSCASGTCAPVSLTAHVQELLSTSSNCNGPLTSISSPTLDNWYNYGSVLTVSCNGVWGRAGGVGTRGTSWSWDGGTPVTVATTSRFVTSSVTMNSHHTLNVNMATQYQLTLDAGATRALSSATSPTITSDKYWYDSGTAVTYQGNGVFGRSNGFGNRSSSWYLDSGVPTPLSTTGTFNVATTMSSPHTVHVITRSQWQVSLDAVSAIYLKSITAPTVAGDKYWYDAGTHVTLTLNGTGNRASGTGSRLVSYSINGGTSVPTATTGIVTILNSVAISGREVITGVSVTQYQLVLDSSSTLALSSVTTTPIPGDKYWYDSGTQVTYVGNGTFGRAAGTGSRVASWWVDLGTHTSILTTGRFSVPVSMSSSHTIHAQVLTQYALILTGAYSVSTATHPTISGDDYWYDSGTVVSMALQGEFGRASGTGWRMTSYSINGRPTVGTTTGGAVTVLNGVALTSPQTIAVSAVKQYEVTYDQTIANIMNSITPPTISGDANWYDAGTPVTLTVHGVWGRTMGAGYRLSSYSINGAVTAVASSGTVVVLHLAAISAPQSIISTAVPQYLLTVTGGSGSVYNESPPIAGDTGWFDSGTTLRVSTNGTYDSSGGVRQRISAWSIDNGQSAPTAVAAVVITSAITMNAPHSVRFDSVTQYLVTVQVKDNSGANSLIPGSVVLSVNGGTFTASSGEAWVDGASVVSVATIMWHGVNVAPTQSTQFSVSSPLTIPVNAKVYDATIVARDPFGLTIGGADVAVTLANGTTIHTATGGDGSVTLRMIPLGTYQATISAFGLSSTLSGDASVQGTAVAHLPLSWALILVVVIVLLLAVVGVVIILRRR